MGKNTGFLEFDRVKEHYEPVASRRKHYRQFILTLEKEEVQVQGARCLDCGIPFCHSACPVNNVIPDWNELVYQEQYNDALDVLHKTNNFPEITGRVCPAPCEEACTLNINRDAVGIRSIERFIVDNAWDEKSLKPYPTKRLSGYKVVVVGSGPAGLACAQQLARKGHEVTVLEKNNRIGGLMRYGIPDFKLEKTLIDSRVAQMKAEGVTFQCNTVVLNNANANFRPVVAFDNQHVVSYDDLAEEYDAVVLACGSEKPRDLVIPGRELKGVHYAMEYLSQQNKINAGDLLPDAINAKNKNVVVIGGGDTGSDCVGTAVRQGAKSVTQLAQMEMPPEHENKALSWPYWPLKLRTSSSHEEGCTREFAVATKKLLGVNGAVHKLVANELSWQNGKMSDVPGTEFELDADLVFLAIGFVSPEPLVVTGFDLDGRGNVAATADPQHGYSTSRAKFFAAGDVRRGQSLVVWAIREGRDCAAAVDAYLAQHKNHQAA